jgi:hypothetical protein
LDLLVQAKDTVRLDIDALWTTKGWRQNEGEWKRRWIVFILELTRFWMALVIDSVSFISMLRV